MPHLDTLINEKLAEIIAIRQQIHQMPELKYEEVKTSALIEKQLESYGIVFKAGIAKTGLIAMIDSGKPGKTVALRADMDA
jgi:amidohydrolase